MIRSYLTSALRNMRRHALYISLSVAGLVIGVTSAFLIYSFVTYEFSYDSHIEDEASVYRVVREMPQDTYLESNRFAVLSAPLAKALEADVPEIEVATSVDDAEALLSVGETHIYETGLLGDDHFFQVFQLATVEGDPETMLAQAGSIALSEQLAERLFGDADAIGQVIEYGSPGNESIELTVTGVFEDIPSNSHLQFEYVSSIFNDGYYMSRRDEWGSYSWYTYFRARDDQSLSTLQSTIGALPARYYSAFPESPEYHVQEASAVHLGPTINSDIQENKGDIRLVHLLIAAGIAVLLLACVNYANLAIAMSVKRAKEVGARKAIGATQKQIVTQFLGESVLTATIATALSLVTAAALLPTFSAIMGRDLPSLSQEPLGIALAAVAFIFTIGLFGGVYQAFIAGRMNPGVILKGHHGMAKTGGQVRRVMVGAQFLASFTLLAATIIIFRQMDYIQSKDVGYVKDGVVTLRVQDQAFADQYPDVERTLLQHPGVLSVSTSRSDPTDTQSYTYLSDWSGHSGQEELRVHRNPVGYDFLDLYEIPVVMGRGFTRDFPTDEEQESVIINETAFRLFGWTDLEDKYVARGDQGPELTPRSVVGVVQDFNMHSLHEEVKPLIMTLSTSMSPRWDRVSIKVASTDIAGTIAFIRQTSQSISNYPAEINFIDEVFADLYATDRMIGNMVGMFTTLSLLVGALGLFGLVAFAAEMRTKEVGLRKILGASRSSIVNLFAKDYMPLILVAVVVGSPLAYLAMERWLEGFAYRIDIGISDFVGSFVILLAVALLSIVYQTLSAASKNPIDALRYE